MAKKLLKVKIKRTRTSGGTHYQYPAQYVAERFIVLVYETQITDKFDAVVARGDADEYVIGLVEDTFAAQFLSSPDIVEISRAEAEAFIGADLNKYTEKVNDEGKVISLLIKVAVKKETLTADELKALDPNDPAAGMSRSQTLREVMDRYAV